ncbi:hypothetical protein Tco_1199449, partial [Tanacetum coccineum]
MVMVGVEAPWLEEEGIDLPSVRLIRMMVEVEEDWKAVLVMVEE